MDSAEMRTLLDSWMITLRSANAPQNTIDQYRRGVRQYLGWCDAHGASPGLDGPEAIRGWLADLTSIGRAPATRNIRLAALRSFAAWLAAEGEISENATGRVAYARRDQHIPRAFRSEDIDRLLRACSGRSFEDVRDAAIFALLWDSLMRQGELRAVDVADVDMRRQAIIVRHAKGSRERLVPFGPQAAPRLDRYLRARRRHRLAASPALLLTSRGRLSRSGLRDIFNRRLAAAGLTGHPHMTRAGGAIQWRRRGGSTEGLMGIGGWRNPRMVLHYTAAADAELAIEEAHRLLSG